MKACARADFSCVSDIVRTKIPSGLLGLFHSSGLCSLGPECGLEALTSLPGEGGNLDFKSFSSLIFALSFLVMLCVVNSLGMKTLLINYLSIYEFKYKPVNSTVDWKMWSQACAF